MSNTPGAAKASAPTLAEEPAIVDNGADAGLSDALNALSVMDMAIAETSDAAAAVVDSVDVASDATTDVGQDPGCGFLVTPSTPGRTFCSRGLGNQRDDADQETKPRQKMVVAPTAAV